MSNFLFPSQIRGLQPEITRTPMFSTIIKTSASGKEIRSNLFSAPRWKWSLDYGYLKDFDNTNVATDNTDYRALVGFFAAMKGDFDSFLFADPDDRLAISPALGNGAATAFTIRRNFNGFIEVPTFQYRPVVTLGVGGLFENIISTPSDISNHLSGGWTDFNVLCSGAYVANPVNGTVDGTRILPQSTGACFIRKAFDNFPNPNTQGSGTVPRAWTCSVYLKAETINQTIRLSIDGSASGGNIQSQDWAITTSAWTRCSVSYVSTGAETAGGALFFLLGDTPNYFSSANGNVLAANAQGERRTTVGTWMDFYLPTYAPATGIYTLPTAAPNATVMTLADASSVYRVRFQNSEMDFDAFMNRLYKGKVELIQVAA